MSKSLALDDFLGHETKTGGGQFLRGWRKRSPAKVDVFLHRKSNIVALWQHNIPRVYEKKLEDKSIQRRVFGGSWNCLESEDVLKKQYRRERDTGERTVPPVICPVCRMMEFFRGAYRNKSIAFTEQLFRWVGDDPQETQIVTFGGMCNMYGSDKLEPEEESAIVRAKISKKEAWKENFYSKCNYLFVVVDADNPDDGVQIAVETTSLGDHVKECIRDQMTSLGEDDGNPIMKPYALRWEHNANAAEFNKKYKCVAMPRIALTQKVESLINSDPPEIDNIIKPGNITTLRASLEANYIGPVKVDWDEIFGPAERAGYGEASASSDTDSSFAQDGDEAPSAAAAPPAPAKPAQPAPAAASEASAPPAPTTAKPTGGRRKKAEAAPPPEPPPVEMGDPCDECGAAMPKGATVCDNCGAEYELEEPAAAAAPAPAPAATPPAGGKKGINF